MAPDKMRALTELNYPIYCTASRLRAEKCPTRRAELAEDLRGMHAEQKRRREMWEGIE